MDIPTVFKYIFISTFIINFAMGIFTCLIFIYHKRETSRIENKINNKRLWNGKDYSNYTDKKEKFEKIGLIIDKILFTMLILFLCEFIFLGITAFMAM